MMPQLKPFHRRNPCSVWQRPWCALALAIALTVTGVIVRAESSAMPAAPAGVVETGAPSFVVLGPESLGLQHGPHGSASPARRPDSGRLATRDRDRGWRALGNLSSRPPTNPDSSTPRWPWTMTAGSMPASPAPLPGSIWGRRALAFRAGRLGSRQRSVLFHVVQFPDTWLWYSGGGAVLAWRPGQPIRTSGLSVRGRTHLRRWQRAVCQQRILRFALPAALRRATHARFLGQRPGHR